MDDREEMPPPLPDTPQQRRVEATKKEIDFLVKTGGLPEEVDTRLETLRFYAEEMVDKKGNPVAEKIRDFHNLLQKTIDELRLRTDEDPGAVMKTRDQRNRAKELKKTRDYQLNWAANSLIITKGNINTAGVGLHDPANNEIVRPKEAGTYASDLVSGIRRELMTFSPPEENGKSIGRKTLEANLKLMEGDIRDMVDAKERPVPGNVRSFHEHLDQTVLALQETQLAVGEVIKSYVKTPLSPEREGMLRELRQWNAAVKRWSGRLEIMRKKINAVDGMQHDLPAALEKEKPGAVPSDAPVPADKRTSAVMTDFRNVLASAGFADQPEGDMPGAQTIGGKPRGRGGKAA